LSQLFETLRVGPQARAAGTSPPGGRGGAVPAAFVAARARTSSRSRGAVRMLLVATLIATACFVWLLSRRFDAQVSLAATELPASVAPAVVPAASHFVAPPRTLDLDPLPRTALLKATEGEEIVPFRNSAAPAAHQRTGLTDSPVSGRSTSGSDLELALYYHRVGDFAHALDRYRALIERNELDAQAHNNLGLLYRDRHMLDDSARELERAAAIEPANAGTRNNYGVTLLEQNRADEAAIQFKAALALTPGSVDAMVNLALAQRNTGQPALARTTLLRALALDPSSAAAHYNLGQMYDRASEAAAALEHYRAFLENAGPEYASRAVAVRERVRALTRQAD
jgi:Tfp pilus assembly protein PilF